jgi:hypothetical protein
LIAIQAMGFETKDIEKQKYYELKGVVRLPLERYTIELLSIIDGKFTFMDAYQKAEKVKLINEVGLVMSYDFLIKNKIMTRRPKDLEDIRQLELRRSQSEKENKWKSFLGFWR